MTSVVSELVAGSKPYACDKTGYIDASEAIQKAINDSTSTDLAAKQRRVRIPRGRYRLDRPIIIRRSDTEVHGDGRGSTYIEPTYCGPTFTIAATPDHFLLAKDISYDGGVAAKFTGSNLNRDASRYIELREYGDGLELDGLAEFTIEAIVKIDPGMTGIRSLIDSNGTRGSADPNGRAFAIIYSSEDRGIQFQFTTSTGFVGNINLASAWEEDVWHQLEVNFGEGFIRVFIDGVSRYPPVAITGTLVQRDWESVCLGLGLPSTMGEGFQTYPIDGQIASLRFSDKVRHTEDYEVTNARFSEDTNTLWTCDFTEYYDIFVKARSRSSHETTNLQDTWLPTMHYTSSNFLPGAVVLRDMYICAHFGVGVVLDFAVEAKIENCQIQAGKSGILARNNSYLAVYRNLHIVTGPSLRSRAGIATGSCGYYSSIENVSCQGFRYGVFAASALSITGATYMVCSSVAGVYIQDASNVFISGVCLSSEGAALGQQNSAIMLVRCGAVSLQGVCLSNDNGHGALVVVDGVYYFGAGSKVNLDACIFSGNSNMGGHILARTGESGLAIMVNNPLFANPSTNIIDPASASNAHVFLSPQRSSGHAIVQMNDGDRVISRDEYLHHRIECLGNLTDSRMVILPSIVDDGHILHNATLGGFDLYVQAKGGSKELAVAPGARVHLYSDGTEVYTV